MPPPFNIMNTQKYKIKPSMTGYHGQHRYYDMVEMSDGFVRTIDNIPYVLCRLSLDNNWWILPDVYDELLETTNIGPYEDIDHALIEFMMRGRSVVIYRTL